MLDLYILGYVGCECRRGLVSYFFTNYLVYINGYLGTLVL